MAKKKMSMTKGHSEHARNVDLHVVEQEAIARQQKAFIHLEKARAAYHECVGAVKQVHLMIAGITALENKEAS